MRRRLFLGMLAMGYGKLVVAVLQLAMVPVLSMAWGLTLYGQWLMLSAIPVLLGASDFGFSTAAGNRLIAEVASEKPGEALLTFQSARLMVNALSAAVVLIGGAVLLLLPGDALAVAGAMDGHEAERTLVFLCLYSVASLQGPLYAAIVRAMGKTPVAISLDATVQLVEGSAVLLVALLGGRPTMAAMAYFLARTAGMICFGLLAHRVAPWLEGKRQRSRRARIAQLWRPATAAMVLPLSQAGYLQGTAIAVGAAIGTAAVPIYTSLRTISRIGLQLMSILMLPLMPEYAAAFARGEEERVRRMVGAVLTISAIVAATFFIGLNVGGMELLALWTRGLIQPPPMMITFAAAGLAASILWNPLANLLLAVNRHEMYSYTFLVVSGLTIGLCYYLTSLIGVTGAAAAGLVLEVVMLATVLQSTRRSTGPIRFQLDVFRTVIPFRR